MKSLSELIDPNKVEESIKNILLEYYNEYLKEEI